jgi:hypothetical protein
METACANGPQPRAPPPSDAIIFTALNTHHDRITIHVGSNQVRVADKNGIYRHGASWLMNFATKSAFTKSLRIRQAAHEISNKSSMLTSVHLIGRVHSNQS